MMKKRIARIKEVPSEEVEKIDWPSLRRRKKKYLMVVGRREWVSFPELGIDFLLSKVDSGARSSSLHAEEIVEKNGEVTFQTLDSEGESIKCRAKVLRVKRVKSSNGLVSERYFIETTARAICGMEWPVQVSLANRAAMTCPILLGRQALSGYFTIDCQTNYAMGKR